MHASSTLPAFVLSQNQTLRRIEILRLRSGRVRRSRSSFGFVLKFPSTNLLCCRAPPPAPRQQVAARPRAKPEKAVPFSKSGACAPEAALGGGPILDERPRSRRNGSARYQSAPPESSGKTRFFHFSRNTALGVAFRMMKSAISGRFGEENAPRAPCCAPRAPVPRIAPLSSLEPLRVLC